MPNLIEIQEEIKATELPITEATTKIRRKYLSQLYEANKGRNVITYYSGWLQNSELTPANKFLINDEDKSAFMTLTHGLKHDASLDLFLHTPGGDIAATESLIDSIRDYYGTEVRVFVVHLALSCGTMLACAGKQIFMGRQSSLGPVDPQMFGDMMPAHSILREFDKAKKDILQNPKNRHLWEPILKRYPLTLLDQCEKSIEWSKEIVEHSLLSSMFADANDKKYRVDHIVKWLTEPEILKVHNRHLSLNTCQSNGLEAYEIYELDSMSGGKKDDTRLKDAVYGIHWANVCTLKSLPIFKIMESHVDGKTVICNASFES